MNASLIFAMTALLVSWVALVVMLAGIGVGLQWMLGIRKITTTSILISPWNGYALIILFLQCWHFVLPVRWPALAVACVGAAAGLWVAREEWRAWLGALRIGRPLLIAIALLSLWLANRAIGPGDLFDSGLYHYPVVRWYHEHAIAIGLANLHPLYGMDNACHLFDAMLKVSFWESRANHLANGVLLIIWFSTIAISATRLCRGTGNRTQNVFNLCLAVPLVMYGVSKEASSPSTDFPQSAVMFAAGSLFVRLISSGRPAADSTAPDSATADSAAAADSAAYDGDDSESGMSALATLSIVLLCAAAVCIKLSSAALAVPMALGAMWLYVARTDATRLRRATFWWSCSLAAALAITWVGRNVILSGCPLYPSPFLSLPVDWRYTSSAGWAGTDDFRSSGADVRIGMLRRAVSSPQFASVPGFLARPIRAAAMNSTGVMAWLISMLFASFIEVALPALITLFALIALLLARLRRQRIDGSMRTGPRMIEWLIGLPSIIGLVTWFIVSPEPRYAVSSFWILAAGLTALLLRNTLHATRLIAIACVLAIMPIGYRILILKFNPISGSMSNVIFIPAGPDHGMHPVPTVPMLTVKTKWGLELLIPRDSGPMWDPPLPSTSMNFPRLMLRTPDDYESGFIVN